LHWIVIDPDEEVSNGNDAMFALLPAANTPAQEDVRENK
jgi:hypothetical protein